MKTAIAIVVLVLSLVALVLWLAAAWQAVKKKKGDNHEN